MFFILILKFTHTHTHKHKRNQKHKRKYLKTSIKLVHPSQPKEWGKNFYHRLIRGIIRCLQTFFSWLYHYPVTCFLCYKCFCLHSLSSLSCDRSKASPKASSPHSAIYSFLLQMKVSPPFLKVVQ
jgi:hypothetical protein